MVFVFTLFVFFRLTQEREPFFFVFFFCYLRVVSVMIILYFFSSYLPNKISITIMVTLKI